MGLFAASFATGFLLAFFSNFLHAMHLLSLPVESRYTVPAIQKQLIKRNKKGSDKKTKRGSALILFLSDVLLCVVGAIMLILVLYWFNNGVFRAEAPFCMAVGFYICHRTVSKGFRIILQWFLFAIETVFYTLLMPFCRLFAWTVSTYKESVQKHLLIRFSKERKTYTQQQLQNVEHMAAMLLPIELKSRKKKGDSNGRKSKKTV